MIVIIKQWNFVSADKAIIMCMISSSISALYRLNKIKIASVQQENPMLHVGISNSKLSGKALQD